MQTPAQACNLFGLRYSLRLLTAMKDKQNKHPKILITAPSLVEKENISGISTLVRQIIEKSNFNFLHFAVGRKDSEKVNFFWMLKQFSLPLRFSRQISANKIDIVHINTAFATLSIVRDFVLVSLAKFFGYAVLLHIHGGRFLTEKFESRILKYLAGEMLHIADKVLVMSEYEKQILLGYWKNLNIEILANAVDVDEIFEADKKSNLKTIIFFGRIHESKGLKEIIESCRILEAEGFNFQFKCYGTGIRKEFFIKEMKEVLGKKFSYEGIVSGDAKREALVKADIFLLPSYFEGLPVSMLEAMAAKCVIITSDVGSIKNVIEDGKNGFLIEPHNIRQIVQQLKNLLPEDQDLTDVKNNARKTIVENFSMRDYVVKLEKIYGEIQM